MLSELFAYWAGKSAGRNERLRHRRDDVTERDVKIMRAMVMLGLFLLLVIIVFADT